MFSIILKGAPTGNQNAKGRRKPISGKAVINIMLKEGWEVARVKGSHHFMVKKGFAPIPVPKHNDDLGIGIFRAISKHTGIDF
jgi:predicted RNA binding protein YcfA (HicA-like mRNA interferase family)